MTLLQETDSLKKTPLYPRHLSLQGKIVDFSGWALPVYYTSIIAEHQWTRNSASVFDVSHLGEIHVSGPGAFQFLQHRLTNDMNKLRDGKIIYSLLCDEKGFTLDDILICQAARDDYYIIVNAGNIEQDFEAFRKYAPDSVTVKNHSDETACIAVQGPKSEAIIQKIFGFDLAALRYYYFQEEKFMGESVWVSRSGYTGEDGFELFSKNALSMALWDRLMDADRKEGILPAGLGARNTLRLEAGNVLYGHELNTTTTPLEAGLHFAVSFDKGDFVGRGGMRVQKTEGTRRRLVGFKMLDKPVARENYSIYSATERGGPAEKFGGKEGRKIGTVTSGSWGPSVGYNIGMGYVETGFETPGTILEIEIHNRPVRAEVVKLPFVRKKHRSSQ